MCTVIHTYQLKHGKFKVSIFSPAHRTCQSNFESPSGSDGRTVVAADYLDKGSVGGESAGSAEYETVSLIEETGVYIHVHVTCACTCAW